MAKLSKTTGLSKVANKFLKNLEQSDKLKEIANRKNYSHKIKVLTEKIQKEYNFWTLKDSSEKLKDLSKDLIFIKSQIEECLDKEHIDVLMEKYGLN